MADGAARVNMAGRPERPARNDQDHTSEREKDETDMASTRYDLPIPTITPGLVGRHRRAPTAGGALPDLRQGALLPPSLLPPLWRRRGVVGAGLW